MGGLQVCKFHIQDEDEGGIILSPTPLAAVCPQLMSTPLSHCLVDCRLSPSSWPTTTIIVVISIIHLLASSFTPLSSCVPPPYSPIFRRGRVIFGVVTFATSVATTVSVSLLPPPYSV